MVANSALGKAISKMVKCEKKCWLLKAAYGYAIILPLLYMMKSDNLIYMLSWEKKRTPSFVKKKVLICMFRHLSAQTLTANDY